jgi:hypothetical protein
VEGGKWENGKEVREMWAPSSYLTGLLHNPSFVPEYNWVEPLSLRALWSNPMSSSSDSHRAFSSVSSPRRKVPDAVTCSPFLLGTSARVLRPKPVNPPPMVLKPKPPNPLGSSVLHTRPPPLDTGHHRPRPAGRWVLWAPLDLHVLRLDSVNTVTLMYTCACRYPRCQPPRLVTRPPGPSVQASCPPFTAPDLSARHVSTWPSPRRRPPPLHACTTQAKRHVDNHSSQNEHTRVLVNLVFTNLKPKKHGFHHVHTYGLSGQREFHDISV